MIRSFLSAVCAALFAGSHATAQNLESLTFQLMSTPIRQLAEDVSRFGDPARGAMAFYQPVLNCVKCHEAGESGRRLGPDLNEKRVVATTYLIEALLKPSEEIKEGFGTVAVRTLDGNLITGVLAEETDSYLLIDRIEQPEKPLKILKDDIDQWRKTGLSSMPEGLANQLADRQQFFDLVSYLTEIAKGGLERAEELKPADSLFALPPLPEYEARIDHAGLIKSLGLDAFNRGAETFGLRCASCHGTIDKEGSMPTSLRFAEGKFKYGNDPYTMYKTLTHGYGMMNPQRWMVPQQKYEVIYYIREHFLKKKNKEQLFKITPDYLAGLPSGDTRGPEPVVSSPWTKMDYGHSLINTIEVSKDGSNIAQKGIAIRLDDGPGGVESGSHWLMYDHDTMRVAGVWSGGFIDYNGIHFNGVHNRHPRIAGDIHFKNPTGPGWGHPSDGSFEDNRVLGRDGKRYGPLDREWAHYQGMYRYGRQTIIKFTVGKTEILESPSLAFVEGQPVTIRNMNMGAREKDLIVQVAQIDSRVLTFKTLNNSAFVLPPQSSSKTGFIASVSKNLRGASWVITQNGNLRLMIPAGEPVNITLCHAAVNDVQQATAIDKLLESVAKPINFEPLTKGGPPSYPEVLKTKIIRGPAEGPFAIDVFTRPKVNTWNDRMRLTGIDFLPDPNRALVCAWDGTVWVVDGISSDSSSGTMTWKRIAAGLFQPLGIKFHRGKIYVTCRDQIVILHDLNGDEEIDWYGNFNNDHQVTEHFHEFAMGLQTDEAGNFYYAKSARHALTAIVPHHGTLLKVTPDGAKTEILANGFRAANGVCLNPDGSFVVTDQEGHWNPMNRINWVKPGGFYGNMFGYHDVADSSDEAMEQPLCWITKSFDRSPSELLWVDSEAWGPLKGSLLNLSYGYGKVYIVPHEEIDGQMQGGMSESPIEQFPTGVMRGRFSPFDGQLYSCGMFAWAGDQQQPGGFYRISYTGKPVHLPVGLNARKDGILIHFSDKIDIQTASNADNYSVRTWDVKRTKNYGSEHYNEKRLEVTYAAVTDNGVSVVLTIPDIKPTWGMEISYSIKTAEGKTLQGRIHNTIHKLR